MHKKIINYIDIENLKDKVTKLYVSHIFIHITSTKNDKIFWIIIPNIFNIHANYQDT